MKNILLIGCGLLGSSLLRRIHKKKIAKKIFIYEKSKKNILLVVDDAYFEYMNNLNYVSGLDLFKNNENVFILRTFSKIYGLSSLRVGWGYGAKKILML